MSTVDPMAYDFDADTKLAEAEEALTEARLHEAEALKRISFLLKSVGDEGVCKGCLAKILWVRHRNAKVVPYDPDGTNHFVSCADRERFKR